MVSPTVGKVISVHDGDDGVAQLHRGHGLSEVLWFLWVKRWRAFYGANGTKSTSTGALLACDHERGVAAGPTFVDVWTTGLFAHGVKFVVLDGGLGGVEGGLLFPAGQTGSKPIGQAPGRRFWLT